MPWRNCSQNKESLCGLLFSWFLSVAASKSSACKRSSTRRCLNVSGIIPSGNPTVLRPPKHPHYRRFVLELGGDPLAGPRRKQAGGPARGHRAPLGIGDGKGIYVRGATRARFSRPGFLPIECGRFPDDSVVVTFTRTDSPYSALSETPISFNLSAEYANIDTRAGEAAPALMP